MKGAAIHIGPESCADGREAVREALTGECAGQPLSREKVDIPGADAVRYAEGHTKVRYRKLPDDPAWSQTLACADTLCTGTGRSRG
jgi:RNA-directed DNA polymerase